MALSMRAAALAGNDAVSRGAELLALTIQTPTFPLQGLAGCFADSLVRHLMFGFLAAHNFGAKTVLEILGWPSMPLKTVQAPLPGDDCIFSLDEARRFRTVRFQLDKPSTEIGTGCGFVLPNVKLTGNLRRAGFGRE